MKRGSDHSRAVLGILIRSEAKERAHASGLQPLGLRLHIRHAVDSGNARQFRLKRLRSGRVDCREVHAARIEVADLLFVRARPSLGVHRVIENLPQVLLVLVRQLRERAPARILRGNRIGLHPPAHGELVEVVARFAGCVEIRSVEAPRIWLVRRPRRRAQPGACQGCRQNTNHHKDANDRRKLF